MNAVEIKNLNKKYPSFSLSDVSFNIPQGSITGFIGRNGAGKTTTIKSMLNMIHIDGGEIIYFGKSFFENEREIKNEIGYSTGTVSWYPKKKLKQIIETVKTFYKNWNEDEYKKYLDLFGLDENKCACEMSEGMKVKCNLLIALSHNAKLLILDEPTSGLDPFSRDELASVFEQLKKNGVTIFFSTHIISDIEKCADNIVYISKGKIVDSLPKSEFIDKHSINGESLEEAILRMEREAMNV